MSVLEAILDLVKASDAFRPNDPLAARALAAAARRCAALEHPVASQALRELDIRVLRDVGGPHWEVRVSLTRDVDHEDAQSSVERYPVLRNDAIVEAGVATHRIPATSRPDALLDALPVSVAQVLRDRPALWGRRPPDAELESVCTALAAAPRGAFSAEAARDALVQVSVRLRLGLRFDPTSPWTVHEEVAAASYAAARDEPEVVHEPALLQDGASEPLRPAVVHVRVPGTAPLDHLDDMFAEIDRLLGTLSLPPPERRGVPVEGRTDRHAKMARWSAAREDIASTVQAMDAALPEFHLRAPIGVESLDKHLGMLGTWWRKHLSEDWKATFRFEPTYARTAYAASLQRVVVPGEASDERYVWSVDRSGHGTSRGLVRDGAAGPIRAALEDLDRIVASGLLEALPLHAQKAHSALHDRHVERSAAYKELADAARTAIQEWFLAEVKAGPGRDHAGTTRRLLDIGLAVETQTPSTDALRVRLGGLGRGALRVAGTDVREVAEPVGLTFPLAKLVPLQDWDFRANQDFQAHFQRIWGELVSSLRSAPGHVRAARDLAELAGVVQRLLHALAHIQAIYKVYSAEWQMPGREELVSWIDRVLQWNGLRRTDRHPELRRCDSVIDALVWHHRAWLEGPAAVLVDGIEGETLHKPAYIHGAADREDPLRSLACLLAHLPAGADLTADVNRYKHPSRQIADELLKRVGCARHPPMGDVPPNVEQTWRIPLARWNVTAVKGAPSITVAQGVRAVDGPTWYADPKLLVSVQNPLLWTRTFATPGRANVPAVLHGLPRLTRSIGPVFTVDDPEAPGWLLELFLRASPWVPTELRNAWGWIDPGPEPPSNASIFYRVAPEAFERITRWFERQPQVPGLWRSARRTNGTWLRTRVYTWSEKSSGLDAHLEWIKVQSE